MAILLEKKENISPDKIVMHAVDKLLKVILAARKLVHGCHYYKTDCTIKHCFFLLRMSVNTCEKSKRKDKM